MSTVDDIIDGIDPDDPEIEYIAFLMPLAEQSLPGDQPQIGIEYKLVFEHQGFHSLSYSGLEWSGFDGNRNFGLYQEMENIYSPLPGHSIEECLARLSADPFFTVVPTPPGDHEP